MKGKCRESPRCAPGTLLNQCRLHKTKKHTRKEACAQVSQVSRPHVSRALSHKSLKSLPLAHCAEEASSEQAGVAVAQLHVPPPCREHAGKAGKALGRRARGTLEMVLDEVELAHQRLHTACSSPSIPPAPPVSSSSRSQMRMPSISPKHCAHMEEIESRHNNAHTQRISPHAPAGMQVCTNVSLHACT